MARKRKTTRKRVTRTPEQRQTSRAATVKRLIAERAARPQAEYTRELRTMTGGRVFEVEVYRHSNCVAGNWKSDSDTELRING